MTHDDLRRLAMAWLKRSKWNSATGTVEGGQCSIILSELVTATGEVPDAIGWKWGHSVLVECKISRSDFLADAKKPHRQHGTGPGERRYFMSPAGMIEKTELPEGWGLLEVQSKIVTERVKAPRRDIDEAGHISEKMWLLSTLRRIRTREFLIISAEHLEATFQPNPSDPPQPQP